MDTEVLAQLIEQKHALLVQLHQLADRQAMLAGEEELTRLLHLLAVKQQLLDALTRVERRLDPFREQDPEARVWASPARRERARELSARCDNLLREILRVERAAESQLSLRRDQAAEELRGAHWSAQVASAYLAGTDSPGRQFDLSCET